MGLQSPDTDEEKWERSHWEGQAANWIAWTRTPGHDVYWYYGSVFHEQLLPEAGRATLEVGCGEGRVARDMAARGHHVTGVDTSVSLLDAAREADPGSTYLEASGTALPFEDAAFDLVVAYNSLMDVDDMPTTVAEAARVLEPGGRLCVSVTHPLMDAGGFRGEGADAPFVIEDTYLGDRRHFEVTVEEGGLTMTFAGWSYPLEPYMRALEDAGLLVEKVREPAAPTAYPDAQGATAARWQRIPMFLWLRAVKPA